MYDIDIPLKFVSNTGTRVHGLACWFEHCAKVANHCSRGTYNTLVPAAFQPIYVMPGQEITGRLHMEAQSYTINLTLSGISNVPRPTTASITTNTGSPNTLAR